MGDAKVMRIINMLDRLIARATDPVERAHLVARHEVMMRRVRYLAARCAERRGLDD